MQALARLEAEGPAGVERLLQQEPEHAARLRSHLERLHRLGLADDRPAGADAALPEQLGDFRIVGLIGQGGMGVVYRAVQQSLGREVALKVIRPDQLFFPGARERFRREVELVARMQHPGIVPIHAVGNDGGVPYFAMELVRGVSLADVVEALSGQRPERLDGAALDRALAVRLGESEPTEPAALFRGPWLQVVLRIGREVAEALEHAHRRGVLHRDVKPSNIMLTRDGRVLLLDFGLAGADGAERLTRTGSPLGSLAYMPPELLAGEPAARDVRGDVYSLGVTCWELLALRLPYQSSDPAKLQRLAGAASRPRLSALNPAVPWDVETVLATAMDPDPARRYASASLFGRDLDNLLAHRPIEARPAGAWLRLRRWTQRHPARATALAAALAVVMVGPSVIAWSEAEARARIQAQRDELRRTNAALDEQRQRAEAAQGRAEANFAKLQQAVDTMLTKVGDESLRDIPRMEVVRRELLQEALRFYQGFLAEHPDDPVLRVEAARVRLRMAEIMGSLGDHAQAGRQIAEAADVLRAAGADAAVEFDLARAANRLASASRLGGDLDGAAAAAAAAIEGWRKVDPAGTRIEAVRGLGEARLEASLTAADQGDLARALAELETSLAEIAAFRDRSGGAERVANLEQRTLYRAAVWQSQLAMQARDRATGMALLERAAALHHRSATIWRDRLAAGADAQARADAAQNQVGLAIVLQTMGRVDEGLAALQEGVRMGAELVADFPASLRRRSELANARSNLAAFLSLKGDYEQSAREGEQAKQLWERLAAEVPQNDEYAIGLGHTLQGMAVGAWLGQKQPAEARPLVEQSERAVAQALAVRPDNPTYRRIQRKVVETLAELCLELGDHAAAATAARRLLDPALAPAEPVLAAALLARCSAAIQAEADRPEAEREASAAALVAEARALLEVELQRQPGAARWRRDPALANQWGKPGFEELVAELERAGR